MYSVVIVDDEQIVLDVLERYFCTVRNEFNVIGKFLTGESAYEFLTQTPADLVVTDIKMADMTGLELIDKLKKDGFLGKFIIISAYDEFSYAQKAIKYGVEEYLLKPIDFSKLNESLNSISCKIEKIKNNKNGIISILYFEICYGFLLDENDIYERCEKLHNNGDIELCGNLLKICIHDIQKIVNHDDTILKIMTNILNIKYKNENLFFEGGRKKESFYIICEKNCICKDIEDALYEALDINSDVEIYAFKNSRQLIDLTRRLKTYNEQNLLINYLVNNEKERFVKLADIISEENGGNLPQEIVGKLHLCLSKGGKNDNLTTDTKWNLWKELSEKYVNHQNDIRDEFKKRVTQYIEENIALVIRRDDAADYVNYHPVYFSRQFAKVFGVSFQEYVLSVKMEKAKEYIRQDIAIERVAELVGYSNYKYFIKNFRKYVGISPIEYYAKANRQGE